MPLTCVLGHAVPAGAGAQVERLPQLQVQEPHLQEGVDVARGTQVGQAHKGVLGSRKRASSGHLSCPQRGPGPPGGVGYLLAALAVGVVDVVEAVLINLTQPRVLPDAHQAVGVPPAVPPGEPDPSCHPHVPWGLAG